MTVELIESFLTLVELRNFTKAANKLCISQSALTHRMNLLEEEVGLKLISRSRGNRSLGLTQAGTEFISIANRWLNLSRDTKNFKSDFHQLKLSVASIESISLILGPFFSEQAFIPSAERNITLDIHVFPSLQVMESIENFEVDIGFTALQRASKYLKIEPIFREKHYLIGNLQSDIRTIDPRTLDPNKELITNWSTDYMHWHDDYLGPTTRPLLAVETALLAASFMKEGVWCIVPSCTVAFLQRASLFYGHSIQVYDMTDAPPDRICYKITHVSPRANRIESIRYFEKNLRIFLKQNQPYL